MFGAGTIQLDTPAQVFTLPVETVADRTVGTSICHKLHAQILEFENAAFCRDLQWTEAENKHWISSRSLFTAAVLSPGGSVKAALSMLLVERRSFLALIQGRVAEKQLKPWTWDSTGRPILYLASVISREKSHLLALYRQLATDVDQALHGGILRPCLGACIAAGSDGLRHMTKNGFWVFEKKAYLGKYPLMLITARTAATDFWKDTLRHPGT